MIKYTTMVNEVGPNAREFLEEDMMVTFGDNAPQELRPYCFLVEDSPLVAEIAVGDYLMLGEEAYLVTGVGDQVNKNLKDLGHITMNFKGVVDSSMAGTLYLEQKAPVEVNAGTRITIESR